MFDSSYSFSKKGIFKDFIDNKEFNTTVYVFKTQENYKYVVRFEEYISECYHVCFYLKSNKKHPFKYELNSPDGNPTTKLRTVLDCLIDHFKNNYYASFIIIGARKPNEKLKDNSTSKYRIYKYMIKNLISSEHFYHYESDEYNAYILLNKQYVTINNVEKDEYIKKIEDILKEKSPIH